MAFIYVAEYERMPMVQGKFIQCADEQCLLAEQRVVNTGASTQSSAFQANTRFIRVHADSICSIAINSNPTATTSTKRMAAGTTEYFGVAKGQSWEIAAVLNT